MSNPVKVDGIGTRLKSDGTFDEVNVGGHRPEFVRLYAAEAIAKGEAVCIDVSTSTNGLGNHIVKAKGDSAALSFAIGIAAEAIASGDIGLVQVAGVCEFAILLRSTSVPGQGLSASDTAGAIDIRAGATDAVLAISLAEGSSDTAADSTVLLTNPANL
jgi:hypothetical protein